jgi:hypothetical protein
MASKTNIPVLPGAPRSYAGPRQMDGTPTTVLAQAPRSFKNGGPRPLADRQAVPNRASDSGMESSMQGLADRLHPQGED